MNRWRPFDIKSFLKASRHWDEDIRRLQEEHDNLSELPAMGNNPGRSSDVTDLTAQVALKRLKIVAEIEEIRLYKEMLELALKTLTKDERRLIEGFYFPKKSKGEFVYEYSRDKGICKDYVYRDRDMALQHMRDVIERVYYGE